MNVIIKYGTSGFVDSINRLRRKNKDIWYASTGVVNDKPYRIKGFNTWVQILEIDGIKYNTTIDASVKQFKSDLENAANS